jgi:membrane protein
MTDEPTDEPRGARQHLARVRARVGPTRDRAQHTLVWNVWERMLEAEFIDRSVALASKAFVSFFPLIIVVAAFAPPDVRTAIFSGVTRRLGVEGHALATAREAFASADQIRRATGVLGLLLTFFFASSFTTALQRMYLRAWRRPPAKKVGSYTRGPAWLLGILVYLAVMGGLRDLLGNGLGLGLYAAFAAVAVPAVWAATAWFMLEGQVRWRVLVPTGIITGLAMLAYGISASVWMSNLVTKNEEQFGFFGVALALVSWFSGAAICVLVGACAGPVLAGDTGRVGRLIRGPTDATLVDRAPPPLPGPAQTLRLRDAFLSAEDDVGTD